MSNVLQSGYVGRQIVDSNFTNTTAFGTAASTTQSAAFDTGSDQDGIKPEELVLAINVPATPNLANGATLTLAVLADTASTPTNAMAGAPTFTITGTAGGGPASSFLQKIPSNCPEFIAVKAVAGTTGAGNNSAVSFTTQLQF
jgi:hypothetical protein